MHTLSVQLESTGVIGTFSQRIEFILCLSFSEWSKNSVHRLRPGIDENFLSHYTFQEKSDTVRQAKPDSLCLFNFLPPSLGISNHSKSAYKQNECFQRVSKIFKSQNVLPRCRDETTFLDSNAQNMQLHMQLANALVWNAYKTIFTNETNCADLHLYDQPAACSNF